MADTDDCSTSSPPPGLARDIFHSVNCLLPIPFIGCRVHMMAKTMAEGWSAMTMFKLNTEGPKPSGLWVSTLYEVEKRRGMNASIMTDMHPSSGKWNFEAIGRMENDGKLLDASLSGQVWGWCNPLKLDINIDYWLPSRTYSFFFDPLLKNCSFHVLQSVTDRLSLGLKLGFKSDSKCDHLGFNVCRPTLVAKYAGPNYFIIGKLGIKYWNTRLAYYHHCSSWLQTGITIDLNPVNSVVNTRLAFRIVSDTSVFRAAIDTNGIVSSLWEKRLGSRMAVSLSAILNHAMVHNYGLGIGLSFE